MNQPIAIGRFLILACLLLAGCLGGGGATKVNYYLVDPETPATATIEADKQLAIELIDSLCVVTARTVGLFESLIEREELIG